MSNLSLKIFLWLKYVPNRLTKIHLQMIHNITIVDDDEIAGFLTKKIIEQTHLVEKIKVFSSPIEAIEFLNANLNNPDTLPEIILLDLNMPIMDGWGFIEEYIKLKPRLGKKISLYLLSSSISPEDIIKAHEIGEISDYIVKPVSSDKFKEVVKLYKEKSSE
jgi:CheY-like chemotaxis protein